MKKQKISTKNPENPLKHNYNLSSNKQQTKNVYIFKKKKGAQNKSVAESLMINSFALTNETTKTTTKYEQHKLLIRELIIKKELPKTP